MVDVRGNQGQRHPRWRIVAPRTGPIDHDALSITFEGADGLASIEQTVRQLMTEDPSMMVPQVEEAALEGLKFSQCLPKELGLATLASRLRDESAIRAVFPSR